MRKFWADTFSLIIFSLVIGMFIELVISGLTFAQSLQSRLTGIPINLATGWLYGKFRGWCFKITGAKKRNVLFQFGVDTGAFLLAQAPLYVLILLSTGATVEQIVKAVGSAAVAFTLMGGSYGRFLEFVRQRFGVVDDDPR